MDEWNDSKKAFFPKELEHKVALFPKEIANFIFDKIFDFFLTLIFLGKQRVFRQVLNTKNTQF